MEEEVVSIQELFIRTLNQDLLQEGISEKEKEEIIELINQIEHGNGYE